MKTAYELSHVKGTKAIALLWGGRFCGKVVANYSDNPNGSVCTVTITAWDGPLKFLEKMTASAGGYGYDKLSQAVYDALVKGGHTPTIVESANGLTTQEFEAMGYTVCEVI